MFQKIIFTALFLGIFSFGFSHADYKEEANGRNIAQKYIDKNQDGFFWKDNTPTLGEGTPFFMEKEIPSYIEYKVHCTSTSNCGFIIVNIDGDDVEIPALSHSDTPPSIILAQKSKARKEALQFYYFSPLSIFATNTLDESIYAVDPQIDPRESDFDPKIGSEKIQEMIQNQRTSLPNIFQSHLQTITEYKQSESFQNWKQNLGIQEEKEYTQAYYSGQNTQDIGGMRYVKGDYDTSVCNSIVPCYKQFTYWYGNQECYSGCTPVAASIVYGYHQRNNYSLLSSSTLPLINTQYDNTYNMISEIRGQMGTYCAEPDPANPTSIPGGATSTLNSQYGIKYARNHGYPNSQPTLSVYVPGLSTAYDVFHHTRIQVNQGNPFIIHVNNGLNGTATKAHSVVGYGYYINYNAYSYYIALNAGWGHNNHSHVIINLSSFSFSVNGYNKITAATIFKIQ